MAESYAARSLLGSRSGPARFSVRGQDRGARSPAMETGAVYSDCGESTMTGKLKSSFYI